MQQRPDDFFFFPFSPLQNAVLILSPLWLVQQGNGAEGGPDLSQRILTWCVGLHHKLQWMLRRKKQHDKKVQWYSSLTEEASPPPPCFFFFFSPPQLFLFCHLKKKMIGGFWILATASLPQALICRAPCIALTISPFPVPEHAIFK